METLNEEIGTREVHQICARHKLGIKELKSLIGSFDKKIFFINNEYLLRVSESSMAVEQEKFSRVDSLQYAPKITHAGVLDRDIGPVHYTLLTLLPGDDFVNVYTETSSAQQVQLGKDVAIFLDSLYAFEGTHYDIGHYLPAIPNFSGTWREGREKYWEKLKKETEELQLKQESIDIFERAFDYLRASAEVLDFQAGPKLLHNDFHPRNTLLYEGKFSGVIDWECSQYGEADFELSHFIHWCVYPPKEYMDFRSFLRSLFEASPKCAQVSDLVERLTIYQIEHEIQQIIWHSAKAKSWRVPRLAHWMSGGVDKLFGEIS